MRLALLSDLHANRQALDACLAHAQAAGAERHAFLGDLVGYGGDPAYVVQRVMDMVEQGALVVKGNHDHYTVEASVSGKTLGQMGIDWTREQLSDAQRRFLAELPLTAITGNVLLVHASAAAPAAWHYVENPMLAALSLVAGAEYQKEEGGFSSLGDFDFDGNADNLDFELTRTTTSVFAEGYAQVVKELSLQVGVRHDKITDIDGVTTWHLGAVWELPNRSTTFKASYSEGFKAPSFFALGFPIGANPDLQPETSRNFELTWAQRLDAKGSLLQVSVYQIDHKNLVDFVVDPNTFAPMNVNRGLIVVKGIEPKLNWRVSDDLLVRIGLTYLDISEQDGLAPLRNRPTKTASAGVEYNFDKASSVFAVLNYTGNFLDRSNPTGDITLGSYSILDAGYTFNAGPVQATFAIDNLLDRSYEQFVGFPGQERRVRMGLRVSF